MARVIHVLTGCTAVGKTDLALQWAEARGAEIVSCDSLLFYRGMDIGTAKPSRAEMDRVPHHLVDIRDLTQPMDVTEYVALARAAVDAILARGHAVLVTGGSGFYLKAFFGPVADEVDVPDELRRAVRTQLEHDGLDSLVAELARLNPGGLGSLEVRNPRRVTRALERCRASGRTLAQLQAAFAAQPAPFADCTVQLVELVREKPDLDARIGRRVAGMLAAGLMGEVRDLLAQGLAVNPSAAKAIGYRETIDFLHRHPAGDDGSPVERAALGAAIEKNTRALVKKQRTWFKTQLPPHAQVPAATARAEEIFSVSNAPQGS